MREESPPFTRAGIILPNSTLHVGRLKNGKHVATRRKPSRDRGTSGKKTPTPLRSRFGYFELPAVRFDNTQRLSERLLAIIKSGVPGWPRSNGLIQAGP